MDSKKLLKNGTVLAWDEAAKAVQVLPCASVLIVDDRITLIAETIDEHPAFADAEVINVEGKIVSPGFVNTHFHSWQSVYRSIGADVILAQYFSWMSQMSDSATKAFTPDDVYISSLEGYLEGLNGGVTSFVEHAHNNWSHQVLEPGYDAAVDSNARVWWCYDIFPRNDFSTADQCNILDRINAKADDPRSSVSLGLSLDGLVASGNLGEANRMAKKLNLEAFTLHHLGGPWPQGQSSPARMCEYHIQDTGLPVIFSHASFLTKEDMEALRTHNLHISITPESEFHYGHGQITGHLISDQASLGVDTNWTFSGDILGQARLWLQSVRKTNYEKTLHAGLIPNRTPMAVEQAFLLATRQGGRAVGRSDIGVLQVGAKADIVIFCQDSPNMLGCSNPLAAVMLHANTGDIEHVLVDGQFRKRDFKLTDLKLDWDEVRSRFLEAARRIQTKLKHPIPLTDKLFGVGEMGDVQAATTVI